MNSKLQETFVALYDMFANIDKSKIKCDEKFYCSFKSEMGEISTATVARTFIALVGFPYQTALFSKVLVHLPELKMVYSGGKKGTVLERLYSDAFVYGFGADRRSTNGLTVRILGRMLDLVLAGIAADMPKEAILERGNAFCDIIESKHTIWKHTSSRSDKAWKELLGAVIPSDVYDADKAEKIKNIRGILSEAFTEIIKHV